MRIKLHRPFFPPSTRKKKLFSSLKFMVGWRVYEVYGVEMVPMVSQRSDDLISAFSSFFFLVDDCVSLKHKLEAGWQRCHRLASTLSTGLCF